MAKPPDDGEATPDLLLPSAPAPSQEQAAKALYMQHKSAADISRELGVSLRQIARWRTEGDWALEREQEDRSLIEDGFSGRKVTVARLATMTVEQLQRGMEHLARRPEPPSLQEMERLANIAANLDRVSRLDSGKATDNINLNSNVRMSIEDIRRTILADPFGPPKE
jgi:hypothetical protein